MKLCLKCNKLKYEKEYYQRNKEKNQLNGICKTCKSIINHEQYLKGKDMWIYVIKVDGLIRYVGSTINLNSRLISHRNHKKMGGFAYIAKKEGINLTKSEIELYVCDLLESRLNMDENDMRFYEHQLIQYFKSMNEPLLNIKNKIKFYIRDRYIDEISIEDFKFIKQPFAICN